MHWKVVPLVAALMTPILFLSAAPVHATSPESTPTESISVPAASQGAAPRSSASQFSALAQKVKTARPREESSTGTTYQRSAFKHWVRQPDGCTTREVVLTRDATEGSRDGCKMVNATWVSPYDGVTTNNPSAFDIDHMVPLKEAWVSGARDWTPEQRTAFANDLGYRDSLLAVSASSNRSKGDRGPARWMPPEVKDDCAYVSQWVAVKWRWNLTMDAKEKKKVKSVLSGCGSSDVPLPKKAG